jgi:acetylornithine deacetylase/succinyl-diaminopimelate desuccinylase-like protein
MSVSTDALAAEAQELLGRLVRFNTVNPPGNELEAQEYLLGHLSEAGFECELLGAEPRGTVAGRRGGADALLPRPRRYGAREPR